MNWTQTPPTEAGVYWVRATKDMEGEIVHVRQRDDVFVVTRYSWNVADGLGWWWYGPLVCPPMEEGGGV